MEIDNKEVEELMQSANIMLLHELKTFYLLGDTEEYDNFEPTQIDENAQPFDLYKKACCLYAGYKIDENEKEAQRFWQLALDKGETNSMVELSTLAFINNEDVKGYELLQKSANLGNDIAQYRISICYFIGKGTKENPEKAFAIIKKLAENKFPNAVYLLGSFYFNDNGLFVGQDKQKGWDLIKQASALGSPFAQYEVAIQYFLKKDKDANFADVVGLMEKSAEGGDLRALYVLSLAYAKGEGVKVDLKKAMNYLAQSYEGGFPLAVKLMETISKNAKN